MRHLQKPSSSSSYFQLRTADIEMIYQETFLVADVRKRIAAVPHIRAKAIVLAPRGMVLKDVATVWNPRRRCSMVQALNPSDFIEDDLK